MCRGYGVAYEGWRGRDLLIVRLRELGGIPRNGCCLDLGDTTLQVQRALTGQTPARCNWLERVKVALDHGG